jgi:hypothetical protein
MLQYLGTTITDEASIHEYVKEQIKFRGISVAGTATACGLDDRRFGVQGLVE